MYVLIAPDAARIHGMLSTLTRRHAAVVAILAGAVISWTGPVFAQCPMCRQALASPEGQQMVEAFRAGIPVLRAAPFTVFATVALLAVRAQRRRESAAPPRKKGLGGFFRPI